MNTNTNPIKIGKLDAARRQLETAIILWFNGGDPVATHTLAFASYEIVHTISKKRDPNRRDLLFDAAFIKDEHRKDSNVWIKSHANFFKHGDREGESVIDFHPALSELFIMCSILGLELSGERKSVTETAFIWWIYIHKPHWLTESGRKVLSDSIPVDGLAHLRTVSKGDFLKAFRVARAAIGR